MNNILSKLLKIQKIEIFFYFIIILYVFTPFINKQVNSFSQLFLGLFLFFLIIKNPSSFRTDKMTLLFIAAIIIQILSWVSVKYSYPDFAYHVPRVDRLGKLFLFIPLAWGLKKTDNKFINYLFILAFIGFFTGMIIHSSFLLEVSRAIKGMRVDFGIRNAQHPSMVFGIMFLFGFINLFFIDQKKICIFFWVIFLIISFTGVVFTQSKQTYLAIGTACFFVIPMLMIHSASFNRKKKILLLMLLILCSLIFSLNMKFFFERFDEIKITFSSIKRINSEAKEISGIEKKIDFYVQSIPDTSSGIRLKSAVEALKWIMEKPVLGWGSNGRGLVLKKSENFSQEIIETYDTLHNYFIEIFVAYGLAGIIVVLMLYYFVLSSAYQTRLSVNKGFNSFLICLAFVPYWLVINNFESYNAVWTGVFMHNLFCGCLYSRYLKAAECSYVDKT